MTSACSSNTKSAAAATKVVTYRGAFVTSGADAPIYYAVELGYFAQEGLQVQISDSKGSPQTITDVSNGGSDFGEANATSIIAAVAQGQSVVSVATTIGKSSFGFFVPTSAGISSIRGLKGKSVVATALITPNLDAALAAGGLSKNDITPVDADSTALITTYLSGKVDALYTTAVFAPALARRPSRILLQADAGFNPPDYALIARSQMLKDDPSLVRRFVDAMLRGFEAAKKNPQAAISALLAKHPELDRNQALATLEALFPFYCARTQAGAPYGKNALVDWSTAAAALQRSTGFAGTTNGSRFATNQLFEGSDPVAAGTC